MKKTFLNLSLSLVILGTVVLVSCEKKTTVTSENNEVITVTDTDTYNLDTANSSIEWTGYKILKTNSTSHYGTLLFKEGEVFVKDNKVTGGKFVVDMGSIANQDLKDDKEASEKLDKHLKNEDFFNVEKYPHSIFEITKISENEIGDYNSLVEGNLKIKDITKPVTFRANITVNENNLNIATEPTDIMRKDFGVEFEAPLANGIIKNEITLQISLKAVK